MQCSYYRQDSEVVESTATRLEKGAALEDSDVRGTAQAIQSLFTAKDTYEMT